MSDFIIRQGDLVVCIDADLPAVPHPLQEACGDRLSKGEEYRVSAVVWLYGEKGLHIEGKDHRPTDGWRASRFRKIRSEPARLSEQREELSHDGARLLTSQGLLMLSEKDAEQTRG